MPAHVEDKDVLLEMEQAAARSKKVYDNRIVTFAPLYAAISVLMTVCIAGFRRSNAAAHRRKLDMAEIEREVRFLRPIGHKRLIVVYGEHPQTDVDYIAATIQAIAAVE